MSTWWGVLQDDTPLAGVFLDGRVPLVMPPLAPRVPGEAWRVAVDPARLTHRQQAMIAVLQLRELPLAWLAIVTSDAEALDGP